jgi:peroxiredoxin
MHAYRDQYAQLFQDGQDVVLIGISTDSVEALQSWAEDDQFQFLFASDLGAVVGKQYGAFIDRGERGVLDNRTVFVIDGEGKIARVMAPFLEMDPTAYEELGAVLDELAPKEEM